MGGGHGTALSRLPAVDRLASALDAPHALAVAAARRAIDDRRAELAAGAEPGDEHAIVLARASEQLRRGAAPSLRRVLNATGVILHTNLGRAPLAPAAREAVARVADGYSNLEYDLERGERGSRHDHVERLLCESAGSEAALAVNNGAGAVLLAAAALAGARERPIVVSRGQLVEIGGGFRIPDVVAQSGARLVEVGTTNRTRLEDYEQALEAEPDAVVLRVHQSNFRTLGFVADVPVEALCELGVPVIDDVGSGLLAAEVVADEPAVVRSIRAGVAVCCFSGDKLLGGPQAGVLAGRAGAVAAARKHPLARALRIDKLSLAALEATLSLYRDPERARREIPALAMLSADEQTLAARARRLLDALARGGVEAEIVRVSAAVGGGALPLLELDGPAVALSGIDPERLRAADPPLIGRVREGRLLLDPRTLADAEVELAVRAVLGAR